MIVLEDADLEVASSGAVWASMVNAGQTCLSVERCYVQRNVYDRFLELCRQKIEKLRVGEGLGSEVEIGPLIHERQVRTVEEQVDDAIARGARLLAGGRRMTELGPNFYAPTLLADVTHEMRIMREETFGPALPVAAVRYRRRCRCTRQRQRVRTGRQCLDRQPEAGRSHGCSNQGWNGNDQRCDFWFRDR